MADYNGRGVLITGTLESWVLVPLDVAYDTFVVIFCGGTACAGLAPVQEVRPNIRIHNLRSDSELYRP
jgi:hypothetical protein